MHQSRLSAGRPAVLSIIIPCYNEGRTITVLLEKVLAVDLGTCRKEIVVVDDGSTDDSVARIRAVQQRHVDLRLVIQPRNLGKGTAVRHGLAESTGDAVIVQDADLEYDPQDFHQMLELFRLPQVSVVFGSRRLLPDHQGSGWLYYWGAQCINLVTNVLYGVRISDQFTCYKMMRRSLVASIPLHSRRFAIDAELVAKLLRLRQRVYEVPITYHPRTRHQGKKIQLRDGVSWLWQIVKYRFLPRRSWA